MKSLGSAAAVVAALRDEAAAEIERLERDAAARLEALRTSVAAPVEDWQDALTAAADREAWMATVVAQGRAAIGAAPDVSAWRSALAREAVRHLPGPACVLRVPAPLSGDEAWRVELERDTGKRITLESCETIVGCAARTPDGRVSFENSLEARERRSAPEWRAALARLYDQAVAGAGTRADTAPAPRPVLVEQA
jgi:vacuolar-type H+-ATPase subunit E/Vma4